MEENHQSRIDLAPNDISLFILFRFLTLSWKFYANATTEPQRIESVKRTKLNNIRVCIMYIGPTLRISNVLYDENAIFQWDVLYCCACKLTSFSPEQKDSVCFHDVQLIGLYRLVENLPLGHAICGVQTQINNRFNE